MQTLLEFFTNPANYAVFLLFAATLRSIGELLEAIATRWNVDGLNSIASTILQGVEYLGKLLSFLGIGNKQRVQ